MNGPAGMKKSTGLGAGSFVDDSDWAWQFIFSGSSVPLRATVDLAGLNPGDVRVEAVVGRVRRAGQSKIRRS